MFWWGLYLAKYFPHLVYSWCLQPLCLPALRCCLYFSVILVQYQRLKKKLIGLKNEVEDVKKENCEKGHKRSNSFVKDLSIIVNDARSASYVLVIVTVYLVVWTPFFAVSTFKTLDSFFNANEHEPLLEMSHVDIRLLKRCLKQIFQDQGGCELNIKKCIQTNMYIRSI